MKMSPDTGSPCARLDDDRRMKATLSSHALIVKGQGEGTAILLVRLSYRDHRHRKWAFPGGFVDVGEALEKALAREVREEIGLLVETIRQVAVTPFLTCERPNVGFLFLVEKWSGELAIHSREILETAWVGKEAFLRLAADNDLAYPEMAAQVSSLGWG